MKRLILLPLLFIFSVVCNSAEPPPANEVFQLSAKPIDPNTLLLTWEIKSGFFIYRDRIKLIPSQDQAYHIGNISFPKAHIKTDAQGHSVKIYRHKLSIPVSVLGDQSGETLLETHYQGCSNDGFCYPPEIRNIKLGFNDQHALINATIEKSELKANLAVKSKKNTDALGELFLSNNWPWIFISFFGFGLLLSFTPCVLPMVPVLSGIILGQGKRISTHKSFLLSLSYIVSMATTYALVGAIVAMMGSNLQIAMQSPWAIAVFSLIFVLLALSMFGFYDLKLPSTWHTKLSKISHSRAGGYYLGAAIMGGLSTLILSPCVTAPLIGALGYIAQSGDIARGSLALFFLGMGMGTPLLLIGTSAGKWVPKTGQWMIVIKGFFGLLLLAVAINLLSRILPPVFIMVLWAALLIFTGIYSGALNHAHSNQAKFRQGVGIMTLIYGVLILIGASQGSHNPLQPLLKPTPVESYPLEKSASHTALTTLSEVNQALINSKRKPAIIDFYADWCATCKQIESTTLQNPEVLRALKSFTFIKVDVTNNDLESQALLKTFDVIAPPTMIFFDTHGQELTNARLVGEITTTSLLDRLKEIN